MSVAKKSAFSQISGPGRVPLRPFSAFKTGIPPHVLISDKDSGKGFISALILLRSRGNYWCFHYLVFKIKPMVGKEYRMFTPIILSEPWIEVPGAPDGSPANAVKFLQTFRRLTSKFSGEEEFLLATDKYEYDEITNVFNKTYDDMWAFSIRKPQGKHEYPVSLEQAVNYIFLDNHDVLVDLNYKQKVSSAIK
jgi:hypothetical protein